MKLNCGQLMIILSSFPPQTKVVVVDDGEGQAYDDFDVKETTYDKEVVIGIGIFL